MSIIHHIKPKKPLDLEELNNFAEEQEEICIENRGEGIYYYWVDQKSTRGFDITLENNEIEVRNTIMSSRADYELTDILVKQILKMTSGKIYDEDGEAINDFPLFDDEWINERERQDCQTVHIPSKDHGEIAIFGPKYKVFFGERLHHEFDLMSKENRTRKMLGLIKKTNYDLPDYGYGNVMETTIEDEKKIMKLLTNKTNYIIDKYDYILLDREPDAPIIITNEILNNILPEKWTLVDEFTIVAPRLNDADWQQLLRNANPLQFMGIFSQFQSIKLES